MTAVSTVPALLAALKASVAGSIILLAPGTYNRPQINNVNPTGTVTIEAEQTAGGAKVVFAGLGVANSSNLAFSNIEMTSVGSADPYYAFRLASVQNLSFSDIDMHGDLNTAPGAQLSGLYAVNATGLSFTNSKFHDINAALIINKSQNITVSNNNFYHVSKGGVEMGGNSFVSIVDNDFHDFAVSAGVHSDAVQIYTAGTTVVAHDILLSGNLFWRGAGDPAQGLFIQDEVGNLPYGALTLTGNAVIGGYWDSLYIHHASGPIALSNNTVASWAGADPEAGVSKPYPITQFQAHLVLEGDGGAKISELGDQAQAYLGVTGQNIPTPAGNTKLGPVTDQGRALICAWSKAHPNRANYCTP